MGCKMQIIYRRAVGNGIRSYHKIGAVNEAGSVCSRCTEYSQKATSSYKRLYLRYGQVSAPRTSILQANPSGHDEKTFSLLPRWHPNCGGQQ
jgi:hypothetical protein